MSSVIIVCEKKIDPISNQRKHWFNSHKDQRILKQYTRASLYFNKADKLSLPLAVEFTRYSIRELDDDNLPSCFKYIRDSIAEFFGVDDSPGSPISWRYSQIKTNEKTGWTITLKEKEVRNG
jgi:hypothetical protein